MCLTCSLPVSIKNEYDILGEKYSECHEILHVSAVIPVIGTAKAVMRHVFRAGSGGGAAISNIPIPLSFDRRFGFL